MSRLKSILVNICRLLLAITFIFSGFVKAIDPLGSQYKIGDYLTALGMAGKIPEWVQLILSISLSGAEFTLGKQIGICANVRNDINNIVAHY